MPRTARKSRLEAIATLLLLLLVAGIGYAFVFGDFSADGRALLHNPWGVALLLDAYVGFTLFGLWLFWREPSLVTASAWLAAIYLLGNLASCVYLIRAVHRSRGNDTVLLNGEN